MFFWAIYLSGKEIGSYKIKEYSARMRIKKLSGIDWIWTVISFVALSLASFLIAKIVMPKLGFDATPFFFQNMPLSNSMMWILYVWPLFFFFNIFGEEFLWRGYIQPRQELLNKKWTWLVHGLFWAGWHIPMGFDLIFAATPIFFILTCSSSNQKKYFYLNCCSCSFWCIWFFGISTWFSTLSSFQLTIIKSLI